MPMLLFAAALPAVLFCVYCVRTGPHRSARAFALLLAMVFAVCAFAFPCGEGLMRSAAAEEPAGETENTPDAYPAPDFTLPDQYGKTHTLSDYQGKVVFLNFWTTWCPWCITEMPDIEALYHELGENTEDVVFLGIASPSGYDTEDEAGIRAFLQEKEFTYPVVMDPSGELFDVYGAEALPTTWLIRADGCLMGYYAGALSKDSMQYFIQLTREAGMPAADAR